MASARYDSITRYRARRRARAIAYLGGACVKCGRTDGLQCFHRQPHPALDIATAIRDGWAWERLRAELDQCELVCAEHAGQLRSAQHTGWRHGTTYGYTKRGCRCEACTEAATLARIRAGRQLRDPSLFAEHGTRARYLKSCRCRPCKDANSAYSRDLRARAS